MLPQESGSGIKWHEVTWYSTLGAIILFLFVVPILCFYIGTQYQETLTIQEPAPVLVTTQQSQGSVHNWTFGHYNDGSLAEIGVESGPNNTLHITGEAQHAQLYGYHVGELNVVANINHANDRYVSATYDDGENCLMDFLFIKDPGHRVFYYDASSMETRGLIVSDTGDTNCGWALNVRFHGEYTVSEDTPTQAIIPTNKP